MDCVPRSQALSRPWGLVPFRSTELLPVWPATIFFLIMAHKIILQGSQSPASEAQAPPPAAQVRAPVSCAQSKKTLEPLAYRLS